MYVFAAMLVRLDVAKLLRHYVNQCRSLLLLRKERVEKEERIKESVSDHKARQPAGEEGGEEKRTEVRRMRGARNRCLGTDALVIYRRLGGAVRMTFQSTRTSLVSKSWYQQIIQVFASPRSFIDR